MIRLFVNPHRPRRSKSRWRKTLERRYRPHEVVEAHRRSPFLKVRWHPANEAEAREIEERVMWAWAVMGTAFVPPPSVEQFENLKLALEVGHAG